MKVIHVVGRIDIEASGPSYSVPRLCDALETREVNLSLHAMGKSPLWGGARQYPVHIHPKLSIANRFWFSPTLKRALVKEAKEADILHNHGLWTFGNMYPVRAVRGTKCRLITSPRGTLLQNALKRSKIPKRVMWALGQNKALEDAACLHATSEREYHEIRSLGLHPPVAIIPNGVDIPRMPVISGASPDSPRSLLFLGRIHPIKGIDMLLRAWSKVGNEFPEWELHIVGPDNSGYLGQLKTLRRSLGLKRVFFDGPAYGREKSRAFFNSELYVFPSHSENFGVSVAEALAHGVPAIVSSGAPWQGLELHECGWWIDNGVEPLANCLFRALALPSETLKQMGVLGRAWMERRFSWDRIGQMMYETYHWVLVGGAAPEWVRLDSL